MRGPLLAALLALGGCAPTPVAPCPVADPAPEALLELYDRALAGAVPLAPLLDPEGLLVGGGPLEPRFDPALVEALGAHLAEGGARTTHSAPPAVVTVGELTLLHTVTTQSGGASVTRTLVLRPGGPCGHQIIAEQWEPR